MASQKSFDWIINLLVVALVMTALLPRIFNALGVMSADTTNFSATELVIVGIFGILILVGILKRIAKTSGA